MKDLINVEELMKEVSLLNFKKVFSEIKNLGIYPGQDFFLKCIIENEGITSKELSNITKREAATVTKTIQRLENKHYIFRKTDLHDKRVFHIYTTEEGKEIYHQVQLLKKEQSQFLFQILSEQDIEQLKNILLKIKKALEKGDFRYETDIQCFKKV